MELKKRLIAEEVIVRVALLVSFCVLEKMSPRMRFIWKEEWWMYKNNRLESHVTPHMLWFILVLVGLILTIISTLMKKSNKHFIATILGYSLALLFTGNVTNVIKVNVGRPRPDFFYRCYPDGFERPQCSGNKRDILDGRKSFPSGHSSLSWCALSYLTFYMLANMKILSTPSSNGLGSEDYPAIMQRRSIGRLLLALLPCFLALLVAISRIIDHRHHIEDVTVGSILGLAFSYGCYRYYFPSICSPISHLCLDESFLLHNQLTNSFKLPEQVI